MPEQNLIMPFKKALLFTIIFSISLHLCAQPWNELNKQVKELFNKGEYGKAIPVALKALTAADQQYGKINQKEPFYASALTNLGFLYFKTKDYPPAILYYEELIAMWNEVFVPGSAEYLKTCDILTYCYFETKEYEKSERLLLSSNKQLNALYGDTSSLYRRNINDLVFLYTTINKYEKAITFRTELVEMTKKKFGENSKQWLVDMRELARLYIRVGDFPNAEPLLLRLNETGRQVLGENNADYSIDLNYLAVQYYKQGEYSKAEKLYIQSLRVTKAALGEGDPSYAATLGNLALLYVNLGQYENAEPMFVQAIRIYKDLGDGEKADLNYPALLGNLASLYERMGQTQKAEPLYLEALQIKKSQNGEDEDYANGLFNLAGLYHKLGLNEKAESQYAQSLEITKILPGEKSAAYGKAINTVAFFFKTIGRSMEAEVMFQESIDILTATIGDQHVDYATALNNFALLYVDMEEYNKAEKFYLQAGEIWKKTLGVDHPFYAQLENNLALLYSSKGDYKKAEILLLQNVETRKRILGEKHPDYAISLNNLAVLYWNLGEFKKAEQLLVKSGQVDKQYLVDVATVLSESEKNQLLANNIVLNEQRNSFLFSYPAATPSFYTDNFNFQLFLKSFSLSTSQNILSAIRESKDSIIRRNFLEWQHVKTLLAKEYSLSQEERNRNMDSLETEKEKLEKQLSRHSAKFQELPSSLNIPVVEVQRNLQPDEAAIEFVSFDLFNKGWTDSILYGAYILRKNDKSPVFIALCEEKQLQKLFDSAGKTPTSMVGHFYRGLGVKDNSSVSLGTDLYKLVWEPLEPYLKGVKKISYSPAGKLYNLAFQALMVDSTTVLMDKYELHQSTSTRQVALRNAEIQNTKPGNIVLFGNPSFTMDSLQLLKQKANHQQKEKLSTSIYTPKKRDTDDNTWNDLRGTEEEVNKIKQLFDLNKISTKSFTQTKASEANLKAFSGISPQILHIATHGFFLPGADTKRKENNLIKGNTYTLANDPLLRSGLILAGGNYAWSGKKPIDGVEDGIATAYEISQLNLSNTELVVLSACETALGDVKGSEGVFGLQRAFKMAGVKKMIVSLWQVPDKETAELMIDFYSYWMKGKTIEESFTLAQAGMRKKYSPFYWAGFVLIE